MTQKSVYQTLVPKKQLSLTDAIAIIVGIVVGAGIFRTPSLVAAQTDNETSFLMAWVVGGIVSFIGALCYAELATAFSHTGGDYHFLRKAYGKRLAFLFAWARMSIIQTGSIALLAFIFGDYASQIYSLGEFSPVIYAALLVICLTALNVAGISLGAAAQKLFTITEVGGALLIIFAGLFFAAPVGAPETISEASPSSSGFFGLAMVFVLLTFGGWNEAAYISAELKAGKRRMVKALIISIILITLIYLLINIAYLHALGHTGLSQSKAPGSDLMQSTWGDSGAWLISILIAVSALTSANATIFTGARTNYALGKDFKSFSALGKWNSQTSGPVNALLVQGLISLALIGLGLFTRSGFETIVEYTAPIFWFFFLLVGIALFRLRKKEPNTPRPFRVPLYPVLPIIFCLSSAYLLYSSLTYTGLGALIGVLVLVIGAILLLMIKKKHQKQTHAVVVN